MGSRGIITECLILKIKRMNLDALIFCVMNEQSMALISLIITIISVFLCILFHRKSIKKKKPTYCARTINVVKDGIIKIEAIEILFKGKRVEGLSMTEIAVWNAGKETINSSDVANNDMFMIELDGDGQILDYEIIYVNNKANAFEVRKFGKKSLAVIFDYFDYNEGFIVRLYHTGANIPLVRGAFKGVKSVTVKPYVPQGNFWNKFVFKNISPKIIRRILGIVFMVMPFFIFMDVLLSKMCPDILQKIERISLLIRYPIMTCVVLVFWNFGYVLLKRRVPKDFKLFEQEF